MVAQRIMGIVVQEAKGGNEAEYMTNVTLLALILFYVFCCS